jgi:hypothetical protein
MSEDGDVIDGVPVPLYVDPEREKEREKAKEKAKQRAKESGKDVALRVPVNSGWPSLLNLENLFGRRKVRVPYACVQRSLWCGLILLALSASPLNTNMPSFLYGICAQLKRTGTLKVDVQFIPWLSNQNQSSRSSEPALDFTLQRDGVSHALARDLDLKFRKLPSGASPGLLDWAELTSTLATQLRSSGLGSRPSAAASAIVSTDLSNSAGALERDDSSNIGMVQNLHPAVMNGKTDIGPAAPSSIESQVDTANQGAEGETAEEMRRHHRMARGISEGRHLAQICSLDNAETDTQASIWADFARKQVNEFGW